LPARAKLRGRAETVAFWRHRLIGGGSSIGALMIAFGKVVKVTRDGKLVVKAQVLPKLGAKVYDSSANAVGYVYDIIGPVSSPYVVVKITSPSIQRPDYLLNRLLYATEIPRRRGGAR